MSIQVQQAKELMPADRTAAPIDLEGPTKETFKLHCYVLQNLTVGRSVVLSQMTCPDEVCHPLVDRFRIKRDYGSRARGTRGNTLSVLKLPAVCLDTLKDSGASSCL